MIKLLLILFLFTTMNVTAQPNLMQKPTVDGTVKVVVLKPVYKKKSHQGDNNPFGIKQPSGAKWAGSTGKKNGYAVFKEVEYSIRAATRILERYQNEHDADNIQKIVNRYAPAKYGNDPQDYAKKIVQNTTIEDSKQVIELFNSDGSIKDKALLKEILLVMAKLETGNRYRIDETIIENGFDLYEKSYVS